MGKDIQKKWFTAAGKSSGSIKKWTRGGQWLQKFCASKSKGLILLYHRIAETQSDPWSLCVTPDHFAEHLEILQQFAHPLSLQELVEACQQGNIPDCAVVVTFDDGYADNFYNTVPLLERYGIPATLFLTTGLLDQGREFWWDELEQVFLQPGTLPDTLCLQINGRKHRWELNDAAYYSEDDYRANRNRLAWQGEPNSRHFLYYSIWQLLQPLPHHDRLNVLDDIVLWAGVESLVRPAYRPLLPDEVYRLGKSELIELGAHSVNHPLLGDHSIASQWDEIYQSKLQLEKILKYPVRSFSYPHGNFTAETVNLVQEAGFNCACSTAAEVVYQHDNIFKLPRCQVQNCNGEVFAKWWQSRF